MPQAIPYIVAAAAVAGAASSIEAGRSQKKSSRLQQSRADAQAAIERRKAVREDRIRRAALVNAGAVTGTGQSSSATSAGFGLTNQRNANIGQSFATQAISGQIASAEQRSANFSNAASIFGTIGSTASMYGQFSTPKGP